MMENKETKTIEERIAELENDCEKVLQKMRDRAKQNGFFTPKQLHCITMMSISTTGLVMAAALKETQKTIEAGEKEYAEVLSDLYETIMRQIDEEMKNPKFGF